MAQGRRTGWRRKFTLAAVIALTVGIVAAGLLFFLGNDIAVLSPKGSIAQEQYDLLLFTVLLSLIIIVPVFTLTFYVAWKYREGNKKAKYNPEWDNSRVIESIWWLVPVALILMLAVITWRSSHQLDPYKALESDKTALTVQVVALEWKWLFIYPQQGIASVNYLQLPVDTPVNFQITSDAPMNSFWIPKLGGQVYAMAGMQTKLHLLATEPGEYPGVSANISGEGFASMRFTARVGSQAEFDDWAQTVRASNAHLDAASYHELARPGTSIAVSDYGSIDPNLYATVINKYMMPGMRANNEQPSPTDSHQSGGH